jgi:hypothetical protein
MRMLVCRETEELLKRLKTFRSGPALRLDLSGVPGEQVVALRYRYRDYSHFMCRRIIARNGRYAKPDCDTARNFPDRSGDARRGAATNDAAASDRRPGAAAANATTGTSRDGLASRVGPTVHVVAQCS